MTYFVEFVDGFADTPTRIDGFDTAAKAKRRGRVIWNRAIDNREMPPHVMVIADDQSHAWSINGDGWHAE